MDTPEPARREASARRWRRGLVWLGVLTLAGLAAGAVILPVVENVREGADRAK